MTATTMGTRKPLADHDWLSVLPPDTTRDRAIVEPATGVAASGVTWTNASVENNVLALSNVVLRQSHAIRVTLPVDAARQRWLRLKESHFTPEGRQARIDAGLKALEEAIIDSPLDPETIRWIAEDADLEDI